MTKEDVKDLQPTCNQLANDCISRQAAIRIASGDCHPANIATELAKLPPAQPEQRWIPVSERLPEDKTYVLTTIKVSDRIPHVRSGLYYGEYFHNDNGDSWSATDEEVTAWMYSPEPYGESEDKE